MKNRKVLTVQIISYFFVLLFCYAAVSKMLDFENFQVQIGQSPLLSAYAGFVSYAVIAAELVIAGLLLYEGTRLVGLYASFTLMVAFTVYIYLILNYSDFVPCSCGGILEKMGWTEHLIFNVGCVVLAAAGAMVMEKDQAAGLHRPALKMVMMFLMGSGGMIALFFSSEHIIKKENNFTRRYLPHAVTEEKRFVLPGDAYYFAGISQGLVWLGNTGAPFLLSSADSALTVLKEMQIKPDHTSYRFRAVRLTVSGNQYYAYDGSVPIIYAGTTGSSDAKTLSYQQAYFDQLEVTDPLNLAIRAQSSKTRSHMLGLLKPPNSLPVELKDELLRHDRDGIFGADGQLLKDPAQDKLVYLYYYRNEFLVTDYAMRKYTNYHTIDTVSIPTVKSVRLPNGVEKMSAPSLLVNKKAAAYGGLLFIESGRPGLHEEKNLWKRASVIDVYSTEEQRYIGSFYISRPNNLKRIHFLATDQHLFVLAGNELIRYRFAQNITRYIKSRGSRKP